MCQKRIIQSTNNFQKPQKRSRARSHRERFVDEPTKVKIAFPEMVADEEEEEEVRVFQT